MSPLRSVDPAQLEKRIQALENKIQQFQRAAGGGLSVAANQIGPLPGWLMGGQFGPGVEQAAALHIKNDAGAIEGKSPRQTVTNPDGVVVVEIGNLGPNDGSPAQWGMRINDQNGVPVIDTSGSVGIGTFLANSQAIQGTYNPPNGSYGTVPGSAVGFNVPRPMHVLVISVVQANFAVATGTVVQFRARIPGAGSGVFLGSLDPTGGNVLISSLVGTLPVTLPVGGLYSIVLEFQGLGGSPATTVQFGSTQVIQLGAP